MTAPWRPGRWQTVTARRHTRESVRRLRAVALHAASSSAVNAPAAALGRHPSSSCAHTAAAAAASAVASVGMTELGAREKFMLDLQGFLVLPAVLSAEEVQALNNAVDASWDSAYTDSVGDSHPCRIAGHQSRAFNEMRGMLEWDHPHCQPFRELLAHPKIIPCMNTLHGRGWRMDHSPFLICGDGTRVFEPTRGHRDAGVHAGGNTGGFIHGHPWDPEYRYHYANGVMRSGHVAIAFQLTDVLEDWGGFGIIPGSHKVNFPLPAHLATTSLTHIASPLVCPAARAGDLIVFFESALHASLPWFGPAGTERRSVLFRIAPGHSAHRSGRGTHWGGSWTYEASQPPWVEAELTPEQQEVLSAPRGSLASMLPPTREGTRISGGALHQD